MINLLMHNAKKTHIVVFDMRSISLKPEYLTSPLYDPVIIKPKVKYTKTDVIVMKNHGQFMLR